MLPYSDNIGNTELEKRIIVQMGMDERYIDTTTLLPKHFYHETYQKIFSSMKKERTTDSTLLAQSSGVNIDDILIILTDGPPQILDAETINKYETTIKELYNNREAYKIYQKASRAISIDKEQSQAVSSKVFQEISKLPSAKDNLDSVYEKMPDILQSLLDPEPDKDKIYTEFFDNIIPGYDRGGFNVIGARPSVGKTTIACCMMAEMAKRYKVAFLSLEMKDEDVIHKILSHITSVPYKVLTNKKLGEHQEYENRITELANLPEFFGNMRVVNTGGLSFFDKMVQVITNLVSQFGTDVVFIDYIQLVKLSENRHGTNRAYEIGEITSTLKQIAMELNIVIISLAQLNTRGNEGGVPTLGSLKDSGAIEQDADTVVFLHRHDQEIREDVDCIIAKNRFGMCGEIKLYVNLQTQTIMSEKNFQKKLAK